jgi:hypothetical protein
MPIRSSPPYQGFCDECTWIYDGFNYGEIATQIAIHEKDTGHDAAKSYRDTVKAVATTSSYEYRARTTRSGRVVSDENGIDWYTEERSN